MTKSKIWLSSPHIGTNELQYVNEAFATNWIAPLGPNVNEFEKDISTFLSKKTDFHTAALISGTAALHLALRILNIQNGDIVMNALTAYPESSVKYNVFTQEFLKSHL